MLSIVMLSVIMLNVTYKPFVLSVIMLTVVRLNLVMVSVVAPISIYCRAAQGGQGKYNSGSRISLSPAFSP
jgi:hypothetical protein